MEELKAIKEIRRRMIDEIIILMSRKKIFKKDMLKTIKTTLPTLRKTINGNGNDELLSEILEFCRNYKQEEK